MQSIIPCHYLHPTSIPNKIQTSLWNSVHPRISPKSSICRCVAVMDALIRQMRMKSRAGGQFEPEDQDNINRASSQRTRSRDSWLQRQYSKQMGSNNNNRALGREDEIAITIAAAAYAVNSLNGPDHRAKTTRGNSSLARAKEQKDQQEPPSKRIQDSSSREYKTQPKPNNIGDGPVKKLQKLPTFAEKLLLDHTGSDKAKPQPPQQLQEDEEAPPIPLLNQKKSTALPPLPPLLPPKFPATKPGDPPLFEIQGQATAEPSMPRRPAAELVNPRPKRLVVAGDTGGGASEADDWERDDMARIKVKYEKIKRTIVKWGDDKKRAREIERRRAKAQKEFRTEMERIGQIAGGVRALTEERRRNEELKAKEKADRIRRTGKGRSNASFCF